MVSLLRRSVSRTVRLSTTLFLLALSYEPWKQAAEEKVAEDQCIPTIEPGKNLNLAAETNTTLFQAAGNRRGRL